MNSCREAQSAKANIVAAPDRDQSLRTTGCGTGIRNHPRDEMNVSRMQERRDSHFFENCKSNVTFSTLNQEVSETNMATRKWVGAILSVLFTAGLAQASDALVTA